MSVRNVSLVCLLLVWCVKASARNTDKVKARYNYLLYLPASYDSMHKWPLLIYLHGGSQKGNDLDKLKAYGPPKLISDGRRFNFIVASPQCPEGKFWSTENWFDSLYAELVTKYHVDTSRIYLTGISMGGYGAFITAMDHPGRFAALLTLCGGCNDSDTARICNIKNIPVWAFHGTEDDMVPVSETMRIVTALNSCKGHIKFSPLQGEKHAIQFVYEREDVYNWLLKQHKN